MYKVLLVAVSLVMGVRCDFNSIMDDIIDLANYETARSGLSRMPLPNITNGINEKLGKLKIGLGLDFENGWVKNISTLARKGNVNFPLGNDSTITLDAVMGLDDLEIHYNEVVLDLVFMKLKENVTITVKNNAVSFELAVTSRGLEGCTAQMNRIEITQLSDINVKFYPNGFFDKVKDLIVTGFVNAAAPILKYYINPKLAPIFNDILLKVNICQYVPNI